MDRLLTIGFSELLFACEDLFHGQDWYQPYLHPLIASDLASDQDTGKRREFPQKGQEYFYFPQKTSPGKVELWKKTKTILSILTDLNFQAQPNSFCGFDLLASGMPERFSESQCLQVSAGLHIWTWV